MNQQLPPPGALPKEVADTQNIKASEGEYVIPADVVRFLGLDHIEKMVSKAKEGLQAMHQNGRIGGKVDGPAEEASEPVDSPAEDASEVQPNIPHMAEGGLVQSLGTALTGEVADGTMGNAAGSDPNFTGIKQFKGPSGDIVYIPFAGGKAAMQIPDGYTEQGGVGNITQPRAPMAPSAPAPIDPDIMNGKRIGGIDRDSGRGVDSNPDGTMAGRPETWGAKAVQDYYANRNSRFAQTGEKFVKAAIPGSGLMMKAAVNRINTVVPDRIDQMIASKKDIDGTDLTDQQISELQAAKAQMQGGTTAPATGNGLFGKLKEVIRNAVAPASGKTQASPSLNAAGSTGLQNDPEKRSKDGGTKDRSSMNKGATGADRQSVGAAKGKGAGTNSGGKYAQGGLVTKTTKKPTPPTIGGIMTKV